MKKLCALALGFVLSGTAVFGEITFSGNGTTTFVPLGARFGDPVETVAGSEVRWGDDGPRVQLVATGKTESGNMGAVVAINADSQYFGLDGNAKAWIKLNDMFKVTFGKLEEDDLRYKIGISGGGFHNYLFYIRGDNLDESAFFSRFRTAMGAHLAVTPLENLYIGAAVGSTTSDRSVKSLREDGLIDVWANAQVGVGYNIPDIGFVRFQFNGQTPADDEGNAPADFQATGHEASGRSPSLQAAFQVTAVQGLNIDIGGQVPLPYQYDTYSGQDVSYDFDKNTGEIKKTVTGTSTKSAENTEQRPYIVGLGFDFTLPSMPLRFYGRVSYKFGGYNETKNLSDGKTTTTNLGNDLVFALTPMYTIAPNWILGLEFVLDMQQGSDVDAFGGDRALNGDKDVEYGEYWNETQARKDEAKDLKNNYMDLGFGLYVRHNIANGDIRVGATMKLPGGEAHEGAKPQLFIPIIFNYNF